MFNVAVGVLGFVGIAAFCTFMWEADSNRRLRLARSWPPTDDRLQGFVRAYQWN